MIKAIDKLIEGMENINKRTGILNKRIENINEQIKTIAHALDEVSAIFKLDEIQKNKLIQRVDELDKENSTMKKQINYLEKQHNIFW